MRIIELTIDEENFPDDGVEIISMVREPAIESYWVALNREKTQRFSQVDAEKRIVMGAAMIPDMPILRRDEEGDFHVYFTKATVRKAMELFFKRGLQGRSNYEHDEPLHGMTIVESWIVDDPKMDKSTIYNLDAPEGTWVVSMKVENEVIWEEFVKTGELRGFSIEGKFRDSLQQQSKLDGFLENLDKILSNKVA